MNIKTNARASITLFFTAGFSSTPIPILESILKTTFFAFTALSSIWSYELNAELFTYHIIKHETYLEVLRELNEKRELYLDGIKY
jgi:hypothetical protein